MVVSFKDYYVYLMASKPQGTLYLGVTSDLRRRVWEHKTGTVPGFTSKYQVDRLVWYEIHTHIEAAILREKQLKNWRRAWKIAMLEAVNPEWRDLYEDIKEL